MNSLILNMDYNPLRNVEKNQDNDPANRSVESKAMNAVCIQKYAQADLIARLSIKNHCFNSTVL